MLDANIRDYFGSIDHGKLMVMVKERISDRRVLKLIGQWLAAGVMADGTVRETLAGTPQGGVISPLLSNIYFGFVDRIWEKRCKHLGCKGESKCKEALRRVNMAMDRLRLKMHPERMCVVDLSHRKESFQFLGWTVRRRSIVQRNPRQHVVKRWPAPRAMKRIRDRVHERTDVRERPSRNVGELAEWLDPVLRGWGNYYRTGNADSEFNKIDDTHTAVSFDGSATRRVANALPL